MEPTAQSLAHRNAPSASAVISQVTLGGKKSSNIVSSKSVRFIVKKIGAPISAVPIASCVVLDRFLDLSELHFPLLPNKEDSAHLTRQQ